MQWFSEWSERELYLRPGEDTLEERPVIKRIAVVGMRHRGVDEKVPLAGPLVLEAEPSNKVDPTAIKVLYDGMHIGYIPRSETYLIHGKRFWQDGEDSTATPVLISGPDYCVYLLE